MAENKKMKPTMLCRVRSYLEHRRALGFQLDRQGHLLRQFARSVDSRSHRGPLTNELAIRWACSPKHTQRSYWAQRLGVVRVFAKHLLLTEPKTQIPPRHLYGPAFRRNPPHLYSPAQIRRVLRRAARLRGRLRPFTFQTLVGLLSCTGLRISEALHLKVGDIDWQQSLVIVRESKYGKSRLVPLHPTAMAPLRAYARRRQKRFPLAEHFFVSEQGRPLALSTVEQTFKTLRKGIRYVRRPPRLHDFRHTIACRILQRWQASHRGAVHRLPILSRFLGHAQVTDTYWYFTAFPQLLREAAQHFHPPVHTP